MRFINAIVLHTADAYDAVHHKVVHQPKSVIDAYHRLHNGWRCIGYHWYVEEDGYGSQGRNDDEIGAHVGGFNENSLGLCVSGAGDHEAWNPKQTAAMLRKVAEWMRTYHVPVERVVGHRETPGLGAPPVSKTCPGLLIDLDAVRAALTERLETVA